MQSQVTIQAMFEQRPTAGSDTSDDKYDYSKPLDPKPPSNDIYHWRLINVLPFGPYTILCYWQWTP